MKTYGIYVRLKNDSAEYIAENFQEKKEAEEYLSNILQKYPGTLRVAFDIFYPFELIKSIKITEHLK